MSILTYKMRLLLTVTLLLTASTAWGTRSWCWEPWQRKEAAMGHSNGVISAPVSLHADVYPVLGVSAQGGLYDTWYICTHPKVNKWSRKKPVWWKMSGNMATEPLASTPDAQHGDSGFSLDPSGKRDLIYRKPAPDEGFLSRLDHFDGYDHNSPNPFDIDDVSYVGLGQASTGRYDFTVSIPIIGILKDIINEGKFGLIGRYEELDTGNTGTTEYKAYGSIAGKDVVTLQDSISWNPSDHKDYYLRDYSFYLAPNNLVPYTVEGQCMTAQFGCILNAPTNNVEWVNMDASFVDGKTHASKSGYKVMFEVDVAYSDEVPPQSYIDTLNSQGVLRIEYKLSAVDPEWKTYYYGNIGTDSLSFFYANSSALLLYCEIYSRQFPTGMAEPWNKYWRITRLLDEEHPA